MTRRILAVSFLFFLFPSLNHSRFNENAERFLNQQKRDEPVAIQNQRFERKVDFSDFAPAFQSRFTITPMTEFQTNDFYRLHRMQYSKSENYSQWLTEHVAPDINKSDFLGFVPQNKSDWESHSVISGKYESQRFSEVKKDQNNRVESFSVVTGRESGLSRRERVDNIRYNDYSLPQSVEMVTRDIGGNEVKQIASNFNWGINPSYRAYEYLMKECERKGGQENYYLWTDLKMKMERETKPARNSPMGYDLTVIDPQVNQTVIKYTNIEQDQKGITGFHAEIINPDKKSVYCSVSGNLDENGQMVEAEFKVRAGGDFHLTSLPGGERAGVRVTNEKGEKKVDWKKESPVSLTEIIRQHTGFSIDPTAIMGSAKFQAGEAKVPFLSLDYDENGTLKKLSQPSSPLMDEQEKGGGEIDFGITDRKNEKNALKTVLFELNQTAGNITKEVIWDQNISKMNRKELKEVAGTIYEEIGKKLEKLQEERKIETAWGETLSFPGSSLSGGIGREKGKGEKLFSSDSSPLRGEGKGEGELKLKLHGTRIVTETILTNEKGEKISPVMFVINDKGTLTAVQGVKTDPEGKREIVGKKFDSPVIKKEPTFGEKLKEKIRPGIDTIKLWSKPVLEFAGNLFNQVKIVKSVVLGAVWSVLSGDAPDKQPAIRYDSDPAKKAILSIGGMNNSKKDSEKINLKLKEFFGVKEATYIRNDSFFLIGDIIQSIGYEYLGTIDKPVLNTVKAIRQAIKEKCEVYVIAHSQGSAIFVRTMPLLTAQERSKIHYLGLGPEWKVDAKKFGLASAKNVYNRGDPVPWWNRIKIVTNIIFPWNWNRLTNSDTIKADKNGNGHPHLFQSYENELNKWVMEILK